MPDVDDAALLEDLRRGDPTAFETLVRRHHASMIQVARYYVGSQATAEDVVQETWIAVLKGVNADRNLERALVENGSARW